MKDKIGSLALKKQSVTVQVPVGWSAWRNEKQGVEVFRVPGGPAIYMPGKWAKELRLLPRVSQGIVAAACDIFKEQVKGKLYRVLYHKEHMGLAHGPARSSVRELARRAGMVENNCREIINTLVPMQYVHDLDREKERVVEIKDRQEADLGRFLTWVNLMWDNKEEGSGGFDGQVEVTLNPKLTKFIVSDFYEFTVEIPVEVFDVLHEKHRMKRTKFTLPLLRLFEEIDLEDEFNIELEEAARCACVPIRNKSGRKKRPVELRNLMDKVFQDLNDAGVLSFKRSEASRRIKDDFYIISLYKF
ncbi:MAG: hypothetical protein K9L17_08425 [Clostridiales bacterium]|nr:hypothetical protein [Clostridiales bacterium]MCF8022701.1 hypothetical protein [Clostridiales bacterium]